MTDHPTLDEFFARQLPYDGTAGFVEGSDTSEDRARDEAKGEATARQRQVMRLLSDYPLGLTWKELGDFTGWHHGQISGALSVLHKVGAVAQLKERRHRCHPYIHYKFLDRYREHEVNVSPQQTKAGKMRLAQLDLELAVGKMLTNNTDETVDEVAAAFRAIQHLRTGTD